MMQCPGFLHVVEAGDTLYLLSRRYRVPLSLILLANPYVNVYNLQTGEMCRGGLRGLKTAPVFPEERGAGCKGGAH